MKVESEEPVNLRDCAFDLYSVQIKKIDTANIFRILLNKLLTIISERLLLEAGVK